MDPEVIDARVRARCAKHRGPTLGFCRVCFLVELEYVLAVEHREVKRHDILQLVDEWLLAADELPH